MQIAKLLEIQKELLELDDEILLGFIRELLRKKNLDYNLLCDEFSWDTISQAEKDGVERGLADVEAGRVISHEEVMKEIDKLLN